VRKVVNHAHDLPRLDRLGEMHLKSSRKRARSLFCPRMCCDSRGWN
jgi:hypothetical protein